MGDNQLKANVTQNKQTEQTGLNRLARSEKKREHVSSPQGAIRGLNTQDLAACLIVLYILQISVWGSVKLTSTRDSCLFVFQ